MNTTESIQIITLIVTIITLIFTFYSFYTGRKSRKLANIQLTKENAILWLILLRSYIENHKNRISKTNNIEEQKKIINKFRMEMPLTTISKNLYLIHLLYPIIPSSLMDMIFEEDFFSNEIKLNDWISKMSNIIREIS